MTASPYRTPPQHRFELRGGTRVRASFVALALSLLTTLALSFVYPGVFLVAVSAPALLFLISGGPRSIDVSPGRVAISYWLRRTRVVPTHTLQVQEMEDELVFVDGSDTFGIDTALFRPLDAHRCAQAIAAFTPQTPDPRASAKPT